MKMQTSQAGINLIKRFESFRAVPYLCPADKPTIGYGSTYYEDGRNVNLLDPAITEQRASEMLSALLAKNFEPAVTNMLKVPAAQNEFDALISFAYNVGVGALGSSTLMRKLNVGDRAGAAAEFGRWTQSGGKVLPGLITRRVAERALFEGKA